MRIKLRYYRVSTNYLYYTRGLYPGWGACKYLCTKVYSMSCLSVSKDACMELQDKVQVGTRSISGHVFIVQVLWQVSLALRICKY